MKRARNSYWKIGYERRALKAVRQRMMKVEISELEEEKREALIAWEIARLEKSEARNQVRRLIEKVDAKTVEILMQDNSTASEKETWWEKIPRKLWRMFFSGNNGNP